MAPLLKTKLYLPPVRPGLIRRPHLVAALDAYLPWRGPMVSDHVFTFRHASLTYTYCNQRQARRRDDISNNARWLARLADRLPAGKRYVVFLIKPDGKGEAWQVHVREVGPGFSERRRAALSRDWP